MVTLSKPSLRMPAAAPLPSIVWPLRSIVMPWAATTRPSHTQSARSLLSFVLRVSFWPQKALVVTGAEPTVQTWVAGVGSGLPAGSTARTRNVCVPTARSGYGFGEAHDAQFAPSSAHWNVAVASSLENVKVALVRTVIGS